MIPICAVDYCDSDGVSFGATKRRAIKEHKCGECGRTITKGETYETFVWLDLEAHKPNFDRVKVCAHCIAVRRWLTVTCNGFVYAGVLPDLEEHWDECEVPRTVAFGRFLLCMKYQWRHPRADRMVTVEEITSWVDQALLANAKPLAA